MPDFLLELFSEEIPARMQAAAATQLAERFTALLDGAGLQADSIETFVTPRRLALIARGLPESGPPRIFEKRGPRVGAPDQAIEGFVAGVNKESHARRIGRNDLVQREDEKGIFYFAVVEVPGVQMFGFFERGINQLLADFKWPKSQRWNDEIGNPVRIRWVRPLRSVIYRFGNSGGDAGSFQGVPAEKLYGHRFMENGEVKYPENADNYISNLRSMHVIACSCERREIIRSGAMKVAQDAGFTLIEDVDLEIENAGLTEWPVPLLGRFDPAFLQVPPEIIKLTMKVNQKYFSVANHDGTLAPAFVFVANIDAPDHGETIIAGNERVLSARLADARFFWQQDVKIGLAQHAEGLNNILFHEKLGTMAEKVERVAKLARRLVETWPDQFPGATPALVERAARLAKADLTTGTVGEFPELQGVIGGYLADAQGEDAAVVAALKQQYQPLVQGAVPLVLALADRLDTLAHFFAADIRPTGSKDPFALRRSALGVIESIVTAGVRLPLRATLAAAGSKDAGDLISFFADRLKVQQREAGVRPDVIDAVFALGDEDDIVRLLARVKAVQAFLETDDGANLLAGYRRAANILRAEEKKDGREYRLDAGTVESAYEQETEKALARLFAHSDGTSGVLLFDDADALFAREDFAGVMRLLATLRAPVDAFFESVTVNDPDPLLRERRLKLLAGVRQAMHKVADFSKIQGNVDA